MPRSTGESRETFAPGPDRDEARRGEAVTWAGLWANLGLFVLKLGMGWWGRSQVLIADGVHSLSDLVSDFLTLAALRLGRKPRDEGHPYGHGKVEDLAALFVGLILIVVSVGLAISAVNAYRGGRLPERSLWLLAAALISVIVKEFLYRLTRRVGDEIRSPSLLANAWHHRSDAFSSLATVAGIGVYLIIPRFTWADMAAAMVMALFILRAGARIVWESSRDLVDTAPDDARIAAIGAFARDIPGVRGLRHVRGRLYAQRIALDLDAEVDRSLSVEEGHDIAQRMETAILETFPEVYHVMVHIEPHEEGAAQASGQALRDGVGQKLR